VDDPDGSGGPGQRRRSSGEGGVKDASRGLVFRDNSVKKGFMRRKTSENDARVVQMSLTDKSYKHIANLAAEQEALHEFIFAEFSDRELTELTGKLASLMNQFEKACLKVAMDI